MSIIIMSFELRPSSCLLNFFIDGTDLAAISLDSLSHLGPILPCWAWSPSFRRLLSMLSRGVTLNALIDSNVELHLVVEPSLVLNVIGIDLVNFSIVKSPEYSFPFGCAVADIPKLKFVFSRVLILSALFLHIASTFSSCHIVNIKRPFQASCMIGGMTRW
jgi:hypothetical protein